jgi:hypothetical protein
MEAQETVIPQPKAYLQNFSKKNSTGIYFEIEVGVILISAVHNFNEFTVQKNSQAVNVEESCKLYIHGKEVNISDRQFDLLKKYMEE